MPLADFCGWKQKGQARPSGDLAEPLDMQIGIAVCYSSAHSFLARVLAWILFNKAELRHLNRLQRASP